MLTREELQGHWNQVKGQIQERWGEITNDELREVEGNTDQLVGLIQQKTGATRREIEGFLEETVQNAGGKLHEASEAARQYAHRAGEAWNQQYAHVNRQMEASYEEAEEMVRTRPLESVGVAFGAGLIAGAVLSLVFRSGRA